MLLRLFREPLFHFFVLGLGVFAWFLWLNPPEEDQGGELRIVVDAKDVERINAQFQSSRQRPPSSAELETLIEALVREEVLVREANALGLDQGDSVVRTRLAQKMLFLVSSVVQSSEPDDGVLRDYADAHRDKFSVSAKVAFEQIVLPQNTDPNSALAALNKGAAPSAVGKATALPSALPLSNVAAIDGTFGRGVFSQLDKTATGIWSGPVTSSFGQHLVRVTAFEEEFLPPFDQIRDKVLLEWRKDQTTKLTEEQIDRMTALYDVQTPSLADLKILAGQ